MKMVVNLDLQKLQLQNAVVHPLGSAPGTPVTGQFYFDTGLGASRYWDGAAWTLKATDSLLLGGSSLATVLSRANHTGTQTAATISDLATTVKGYRLDEFAIPTADINLNNRKIVSLADPVSAGDAVNLSFLQTQISNSAAGIDAKPSVRVASTGNLTLSGTQTIDGIAVVGGDRVLAKNQTTAANNGPYVVAAGAWARATDADGAGEINPGAFWYVEEGTANGKTQWRVENTGTITLGSTSITINQFGGAGVTYTAGNGITLGGNAITAVADPAAGGGIVVTAGGIKVDTAVVVRKFAADIGNGSLTSIVVTHNLGTKDITVSVRLNSDDSGVICDWVATSTNTATLIFATAPTSNAYRVVIHG